MSKNDAGSQTPPSSENPDPGTKDPNADSGKNPNPAIEEDEDDDNDWIEKLSADKQKFIKKMMAKNVSSKEVINSQKVQVDELKGRLAKLEQEKEAQENEKLKEQNKFKELYEKNQSKLSAAQQRVIDAELKAAAQAAGVIDLDVIVAIPRDKISISDDFEVTGVEATINAYKEAKPKLFAAPKEQEAGKESKTTATGARVASPPPTTNDKPDFKNHKIGSPEWIKATREYAKS